MTERFTIVNMGLDGRLIKKDGKIIELERVVDLLNENEQLKRKNKGLQSELHIFKEDVTHSNKIIDKLYDENEQLKSENQELRQYLSWQDMELEEMGELNE